MQRSLRVMIYDRTCVGGRLRPGLSQTWWAGAHLYSALGRFDGYAGVSSWREALEWLATFRPEQQIGEVQYWGHGNWGLARIGDEILDARALCKGHPLESDLRAVRDRFTPDSQGLWWFRTCETLGAHAGHAFAKNWSDYFGAAVAGHTHIIWFWQSGLHRLLPGHAPDWPPEEGLLEGSADAPVRARWSGPTRPSTITCLRGTLPGSIV